MALKNFIKENFVLVAGLALPVLLVILFFVASVLPKSLAVPPQYEMLFTAARYDYQSPPSHTVDFFVKEGAVTARVSKNNTQPQQNFSAKRLMVYDGKTQSVREIPYDMSEIGDRDKAEIVFNAVRDIKADSASKAPDGYEFDAGGYHSGGLATELFVGGSRHQTARIKKGSAAFKIPESRSRDYYPYDIQFIGWVIQQ